MLHVTNGESVVASFRESKLPGKFLSWIDVLHDGPVPSEPPADLAKTRARFISSLGWATYDDVLRQANERDATLEQHFGDDEIILWFEHDLFDQLQLIQVLDRIAGRKPRARLSLINIGEFPGVENFVGLGQLTAAQLESLFPSRKQITPAQLDLGRRAWQVFTAPDPVGAFDLTHEDTSALPFVREAFLRWFEEFPSTHNGLSRTQEQLLRAVSEGARTQVEIYLRSRQSEQAIFMGDSSAYWRIDGLASGANPALKNNDDLFHLTALGKELMEGRGDWILDGGGIDQWLGGTHMTGADAQWRWDRSKGRFAQAA